MYKNDNRVGRFNNLYYDTIFYLLDTIILFIELEEQDLLEIFYSVMKNLENIMYD